MLSVVILLLFAIFLLHCLWCLCTITCFCYNLVPVFCDLWLYHFLITILFHCLVISGHIISLSLDFFPMSCYLWSYHFFLLALFQSFDICVQSLHFVIVLFQSYLMSSITFFGQFFAPVLCDLWSNTLIC